MSKTELLKGQKGIVPKAHPVLKAGTFAFALSAAMMTTAYAQENATPDATLDRLLIEDTELAPDDNPYSEPGVAYKAKTVSDIRRVRPIADTPATITVITKEVIEDSGITELKDILAAQPGITLGTGEGGNSFGDRYIIRGYEARSDVYTDGMREPGLITRETFALEQIEITKGPSSTFAGRGSTGGAVNMVTKKASLDQDFSKAQIAVGTDQYFRGTLETNKVINDKVAIRLNAMYRDSDIPNRAPAGKEHWGAMASAVIEATDNLVFNADFYHFETDDMTDPGRRFNNGEVDATHPFIGKVGLHFQKTQADIGTLKIGYDFQNGLRVENKTRIGATSNDYSLPEYSPAGIDRRTGLPKDASYSTKAGWQENDYIGNQLSFIWDTNFANLDHTFIFGAEYSNEKTLSGGYSITTVDSGAVDVTNYNNYDWVGSVARGDMSVDYELETLALYLMDTVPLTSTIEVSAGLRYDDFSYKAEVAGRARPGQPVPDPTVYDFGDGLLNYQAGVKYSPWEHSNVYANISTSSNINGGEADSLGNCGYGGLCTDSNGEYAFSDPEQSTNLEIGTKWNLLNEKLLFTAAIFQTTKNDVIEGSGRDYSPEGNLNTGKNRVKGIEFGLHGNITSKLSTSLGVAFMESETLESYNEDNVGLPKANFADTSGTAQFKYQFTPKFAFGGTVTHSSGIYGGQPDAAAVTSVDLPGYTSADMFAKYTFGDLLSVRLNINNITDKEYYTATYRGGHFVYLGDARNAKLTITSKF
ncbi:MAG: TonB-dependent siderophore receptor [Robiginitomaculum sp.]|nr:MAG: TonB-dependent siderophore receptor [Robiginitomaculum sp.]